MWAGLRNANPTLMCDKNSFFWLKKAGKRIVAVHDMRINH